MYLSKTVPPVPSPEPGGLYEWDMLPIKIKKKKEKKYMHWLATVPVDSTVGVWQVFSM